MDYVLDAAFVLAVTAFFKQQLEISGKAALLCAFATALLLSFAPILALQFPMLAPWIEAVVRTFVVFLSAAGGYDALQQFRQHPPRPLEAKSAQAK
jgi:hypothetical protein